MLQATGGSGPQLKGMFDSYYIKQACYLITSHEGHSSPD